MKRHGRQALMVTKPAAPAKLPTIESKASLRSSAQDNADVKPPLQEKPHVKVYEEDDDDDDDMMTWKPSVYRVLISLSLLSLVIGLIVAVMFSRV